MKHQKIKFQNQSIESLAREIIEIKKAGFEPRLTGCGVVTKRRAFQVVRVLEGRVNHE